MIQAPKAVIDGAEVCANGVRAQLIELRNRLTRAELDAQALRDRIAEKEAELLALNEWLQAARAAQT